MSRTRRPAAAPADRFLDRWYGQVLPFWAERGVDPESGGFHERLDADGAPVVRDGKRAMVQARQIYVFAEAALMGRIDTVATGLARDGFDFLVRHYRHPDGGWRFRVARDGTPQDETRDLYAQAFVLFALAWRFRLDGEPSARTLAEETLQYMDRVMAHPAGGYREGIDPAGHPTTGPRRQNPHMHLFEAFLEWHMASGDEAWLDRARGLLALLTTRFCVAGTLHEYFGDDLTPAPGDQGYRVEPGHHFEWTWLLHRYRQQSGDASHDALTARLYDFAVAYGVDAPSGGVIDAVDSDGRPLQRSRRLWPQTEAIRAHIARLETTDSDACRRRLEQQVDGLWRCHLDGAPDGGWREHIAADGAPLVDGFPASSLYHVSLAAAELDRLRRSR